MEPFTHSVVDEKNMLKMETLEILAVLYGGLHGRSSAFVSYYPPPPKSFSEIFLYSYFLSTPSPTSFCPMYPVSLLNTGPNHLHLNCPS